MWQMIFDERGNKVGGWTTFESQLRTNHEPVTKVDILDDDLNPIGDYIRTACICTRQRGEVTNLVSDGNIDVDTTRGTRRTAELTLLNPEAEFTPVTEDFDPEGRWVGKIFLNRNVRIWRGVHVGKKHLYVPVGTFMVDACEVLVEQNMSLVNLTMSDHWKKLTKSFFGGQRIYDPDDPNDPHRYNAIIRDLIDAAGIPLEGKYAAVLDPLNERTNADKTIDKKLKFERGESRGEKLKELARKWGIDAFFDPMGVFRTNDRRDPDDKKVIWTFESMETDAEGRHGGIVNITRSFNDDNLYNHVIIIGTGDEKNVYRASRSDNNPKSKTNIDTIGDRVMLIESDRIHNQAQADRALDKAWKSRFQISEEINADVICNPALEGDDVIRIVEREKVKVDGKYRLHAFNIPLVTTRQSIRLVNIIRGDDVD